MELLNSWEWLENHLTSFKTPFLAKFPGLNGRGGGEVEKKSSNISVVTNACSLCTSLTSRVKYLWKNVDYFHKIKIDYDWNLT